MRTMTSRRRPFWWTEKVKGNTWDRVKVAMRHDWMETTLDLGAPGEAGDRRDAVDASRQLEEEAAWRSPGEWSEAEVPYGFGYAARTRFGDEFPEWSDRLEQVLEREWITSQDDQRYRWAAVRRFVRRGYEYDEAGGPGAADRAEHVDLALLRPNPQQVPVTGERR